jgi:hypothetical protein
MDRNSIERHLREGPPNEPAYAGRRFTPPPEAPSMFVARPALRATVPSLAAALLVVIGAVAIVVLRAGAPIGPGTDPGGGTTVTPSPTASPVSPTASPVATATPIADRCTENELHLTVTSVEGAAGSRILNFTIRNDGPARCAIRVSRAAIVDRGQTPSRTLVSVTPKPTPAATVAAGGKVDGAARWSNECATATGPLALTLEVKAGTALSGTVPGDTSFAVPPCNGPGGPMLELHFGS